MSRDMRRVLAMARAGVSMRAAGRRLGSTTAIRGPDRYLQSILFAVRLVVDTAFTPTLEPREGPTLGRATDLAASVQREIDRY